MIDNEQFLSQVLRLKEERDFVIKKYCDDICNYCKNRIECKGKDCKEFVEGNQGYINDNPVDFHWTCEDFNYGTCPLMEHTPCNRCFERDYDGFQHKDDAIDFYKAVEQIRALIQNGQSAMDTNIRLSEKIKELKGLESKGDNYGKSFY